MSPKGLHSQLLSRKHTRQTPTGESCKETDSGESKQTMMPAQNERIASENEKSAVAQELLLD
jgi:hypothetical protein